MLKVLGAILGVAVYIYFIVDVLRAPRSGVRALPKLLWFAVVALVPLIGGAVWALFGRPRYRSTRRTAAPDDDPRFLKNLDEQAWRERMRKLREDEA